MKPTDIKDPEYFHKVVDCQHACPAHTPVPEYIRLIAEEKYTEAYMINWDSNVFPGVLGRTCDRPCEPACRRGRVDEEPVAICRLKRVAADNKGDVKKLMPQAPFKMNGKKIALIGAGPSALTVARDLAPLGYEIHLYDEQKLGGGFMRSQIPSFRLPETVLNEEVNYILDLGIHTHFNSFVSSMKDTINKGYDAIFVGTGAPKGRDLPDLAGRNEGAANIHIGINWLGSVAFEHTTKIGKKVIVLGGGNTAMDAASECSRMGAEVILAYRRTKEEMPAYDFEYDLAKSVGVKGVFNVSPVEIIGENGKVTGVKLKSSVDGNEFVENCNWVIKATGQSKQVGLLNLLSDISLDEKGKISVSENFQTSNKKYFAGGDAVSGGQEVVNAVANGKKAAWGIFESLKK